MVGTLSWFSQLRRHKTQSCDNLSHSRWIIEQEKPETLGILAFDIAKTISQLVSLYMSLSKDQVAYLKEDIIHWRGVRYLTSEDDQFLLTLACAERLEDLDRAAIAVGRLGFKCSDYSLTRFDNLYMDLKNGYIDITKFTYGSKEIEKAIHKMEKFISLTADLYDELESLSELEESERKLNEWRKTNVNANTSGDLFDQKIAAQRKLVRNLKEESLWSQSHDKIVELIGKIVCVVYTRICGIFGPYVSILPCKKKKGKQFKGHKRNLSQQEFSDRLPLFDEMPQMSLSGPITQGSCSKVPLVRFLSSENKTFLSEDIELRLGLRNPNNESSGTNNVFKAAPPSTVGGAGLALRYANVILLVESYLNLESPIDKQARHNLYNLLPARLKGYIKSKLKAAWRTAGKEEGNIVRDALAVGWREAVDGILEWLVPMAEDTLTWQSERSLEKQRFETKPTVLLLQTLHYADLEKTEFTIAEVLSGLSCIVWYENRTQSNCHKLY